jgi:tRNA(Ile)-lysidine synthase
MLLSTITAVHVNHSLQAEADQWQHQCEIVCAAVGVEIVTASRCRRWNADPLPVALLVFTELLKDDVLYLGHHLDDQVENLLFCD